MPFGKIESTLEWKGIVSMVESDSVNLMTTIQRAHQEYHAMERLLTDPVEGIDVHSSPPEWRAALGLLNVLVLALLATAERIEDIWLDATDAPDGRHAVDDDAPSGDAITST
jgi:hypothetical protein